jgi:sugar phosphate isomerase/epimerase
MTHTLSGFADEAGSGLETQIRATRELGWSQIEMRNVEVPGFPGGNLHDIPDAAFDRVVETLGKQGLLIHCFGSAIANGGKSIEKPFDACLAETKRAAARMPRLGSKFIRDHIAHLHIKDGIINEKGEHIHLYPGEGAGDVKRIVQDLLASGYSGAISIKPHIGVAPEFRDAAIPESEGKHKTYVEYGKRLMKLLAEV